MSTKDLPRDRWALVIGIDTYRWMPSWNLQGASRDAEAVADQLSTRWGFPARQVSLLTNEAATEQGIRQGMTWLEGRVRRDDLAVIYFSGHGSYRPDPASLTRRADGREKTLVPSDSDRNPHRPTRHRDVGGDDLHAWLQRLCQITRYVTVILDCCHSGALTRDVSNELPRCIASQVSQGDLPHRLTQAAETPSGWFPTGGSYTLIAACRSDQTALEMPVDGPDGESRGVMTHFLLGRLERATSQTTYQDLVDQVALDISTHFEKRSEGDALPSLPVQEIQLEGERHRVVFDRPVLETMPYLEVLERLDDGSLSLAGGEAHGLRPGSQLAVFSMGAKGDTADAPDQDAGQSANLAIGTVQVTSIQGVRSVAEILDESAQRPIRKKDRATPWRASGRDTGKRTSGAGHPEPDSLLRVWVQPEPTFSKDTRDLQRRIQTSPLLRLVDAATDADLTVHIRFPPEVEACLGHTRSPDGVPRWFLTEDSVTPKAPLRPVPEQGSVQTVFGNLEKWARWHLLRQLEGPPGPLAESMDFTLKRFDGGWVDCVENQRFRGNERFAFGITNRYHRPVFAFLLDLGFGGGVDLLYPVLPGAYEPLKPHRSVEVGTEREHCGFYLPPGYPYCPGSKFPGHRELEILKLIVTTEATDLRIFFQDSCRLGTTADSQPNALERLLGFVMWNQPFRTEASQTMNGAWMTRDIHVWIDASAAP